jgi:hypothetical protein
MASQTAYRLALTDKRDKRLKDLRAAAVEISKDRKNFPDGVTIDIVEMD